MIHATEYLILCTIAIWLCWDWYALNRNIDATETVVIRRAAQHPIVPLAVGILLGHLFACD